jgi:hypothetical protein
MKAKRRIHKFDFESPTMASGTKTHVSLVDKAANLTEALVMKSTYIGQETEVEKSSENEEYSCDTVRVTDETVRVVKSAVPSEIVIN